MKINVSLFDLEEDFVGKLLDIGPGFLVSLLDREGPRTDCVGGIEV